MDRLFEEARDTFLQKFGEPGPSAYCRSPGCVNVLGDHTEYFGGLALPIAVNMSTVLAFRPNRGDEIRLHSVYLDETGSFRTDELETGADIEWLDYVKGVVHELKGKGVEIGGLDGVVGGSLPVDASLGSSSALCIVTALTLLHLAGRELDPVDLARLCHNVEVDFLGVHSEIISPAACLLGQKGMAIKLDCHTLETDFVPLPSTDAQIVICDSRVRNDAAFPEILGRREQCRDAVRKIADFVRGREIKTVKDLSLRDFSLYGPMIQPPAQQRLKHIVTENRRVEEAAESLMKRNVVRAGVLLDASHTSLKDDFEVSCRELDTLVEIAWNARRVLGSRMTGAGFGGATISLVEQEGVANFCETVSREYKAQFEVTPSIYVCQADEGAQLFTEDEAK